MERDGLIAGRYRLEERIGSGGMGEVWRARDTGLPREVALKRSLDGDSAQLHDEGSKGAGLNHPNIVTVHDSVSDGDDHWLVMEYFESRSLAAVVEQDGTLPQERAARIGAQIADALAGMHGAGMVHRDVKPGNVLVGAHDVAKLSDLGVTRWADTTQTEDARVSGTPAYQAPEVVDHGAARASSDVFALGATLFAAVVGHSPWAAERRGPLDQVRRARLGGPVATAPPGPLAPVLTALLGREPSGRPTADAAKVLLERVPGSVGRARGFRPAVPNRRGLRAGAVVLAAAAVVALVVSLRDDRDDREAPGPVARPESWGTVGDERTADPCALLDPAGLAPYGTGTTFVDSELGSFNRCSFFVRMSERDGDNVVIALDLLDRIEPQYEPHVPGGFGPVQLLPGSAERCERRLPLREAFDVRVVGETQNGYEHQEVCAMTDAVMSGAKDRLLTAQVPRRQPLPPESLWNKDACQTLEPREVVAALGGAGAPPGPTFGDFYCYWENEAADISVVFTRVWRVEMDEVDPDDVVETIGGRRVVVDPYGDEPACEAKVFRREYEKRVGDQVDWVEVASVTLESDDDTVPGSSLCDEVTALARAVEPRLPR